MAIKTNLTGMFKMDESKEESGVWVDFGNGVRIKVRRLKSRAAQKVRQELDKEHTDAIRRGTLSTEDAEVLVNKQIALGIIVDWEGIMETYEEDGETKERPLAYNGQTAYELIKQLPELRDEIFAVATDRENYRAEQARDAAKN